MDWIQELLNRKRAMQGMGNGMQAMGGAQPGPGMMAPQPWTNGPAAMMQPTNPVNTAAAGVSDMQPNGGGMGMAPMMMGFNALQSQDKQRQQQMQRMQDQGVAANQDQMQRMQQMAALMRQRMGY